MKATGKKKLCWNCEGSVAAELENCPFCGVYLSPLQSHQSSSSPRAPYAMEESEEEREIPQAPYANPSHEESATLAIASPEMVDQSPLFIPLLMLLAGSVFLLFGIVLVLFSEQGVLTLQWNSTWWYAYILLALPMLAFGWKSLD